MIMTLRRVMQELESTQEPIALADLCRRLDVEPGALEGMIQFLVRKGRLEGDPFAPHVPHSTVLPNGKTGASCFHPNCVAGCWKAAACSEKK